jgi:hypothetical protein
MTTRRNKTPKPRQGGAKNVKHGEDAVELAIAVRCRTADAEAAHVDGTRTPGDVLKHSAGQNDARVGAELAGLVFDVFPGKAGSAGDDVVIKKNERFWRIYAEPLEVRRSAVAVDVIDADEPCVLGVSNGKVPMLALVAGMGTGHVVGDGT